MNVVCMAQEAIYFAPDGGSGADSVVINRNFQEAIRHYGQPATQVRPAEAVAAILGSAYDTLRRVGVETVQVEATKVLRRLGAALLRFDLTSAPPVSAVMLDDGSMVLEWVFADRRLGFSVDPKPGESGWFFVSSQDSGSVRAFGREIGDTELALLLAWTLGQSPRR
jgi:hypothetical protein